jgi:hypothetical protein
MLTKQDRASLRKDGYVVLPGRIDANACGSMIDRIWDLMPDRFDRRDPRTWYGRIEDCCNNLPIYQRKGLVRFKDKYGFARDNVFGPGVVDNPLFRSLFRSALDRPLYETRVRGLHPNFPMPKWVSLNEASGNRLNPQISRPHRSWLKIPRPPQFPIFGHLDVHPIELGAMIYLDDVPEGGGGLAVWPGSHRLFRHAFDAAYEFLPTPFYKRCLNLLQRYRPVTLDGRRGDVILFDNRLMHANTMNTSDTVRYAVLVDLFSDDWRERDITDLAGERDRERRLELAKTKVIDDVDLVREVTDALCVDPVASFWMDRPRLRRWAHTIEQDPIGAPRRGISRKIRSRADGDFWLVVSQGREHRHSYKLDAYGEKAGGRYSACVNGLTVGRSDQGVLVERIAPAVGVNTLRLSGRFQADHYVRIIKTLSPLSASPVLLEKKIEAGGSELEADFMVAA